MKEYKIGDTFCLEDGTKLQVVKSNCNCKNCYFFNDKDNSCSRTKDIVCSAPRREDKEFVIFKQVKDNNMEEKRSIKISLEEAREWYNSGNSFKKELALKVYNECELAINYSDITAALKDKDIANNIDKAEVYRKLLNISKYYNNLHPIKYNPHLSLPNYYTITKKCESVFFTKHKGFFINKSICTTTYEIIFYSEEAAKKAIDILGDELNVLFE